MWSMRATQRARPSPMIWLAMSWARSSGRSGQKWVTIGARTPVAMKSRKGPTSPPWPSAAWMTAVKRSAPTSSHRLMTARTIPSPSCSGSSSVMEAARCMRLASTPAVDSMTALAKSVARSGK